MEVDGERDGESTGSSTPVMNNSSDFSDDDVDLPAYTYTTPKKEEQKALDGEDTTPPLVNNLPIPSADLSPLIISPLKFQPTVIVNDEKENKTNKKLLMKSLNRVQKTREKISRENKIDEIEHSGGVLAMSKKADDTINQVNKDMDSPGIDPVSVMQELSHNVVDLPCVPGVVFFTAPPCFHKGFISLSSSTGNPLIDRIAGEHCNFSGIHQLMFVLNKKECPHSILLWLMENACLSQDMVTRTTSLLALSHITPICSSVSSPIELNDFHLVLSKLGAAVLCTPQLPTATHHTQIPPANTDTHINTELLRNSVSNFSKIILTIMEFFKKDNFNPNLIKGLSVTLLRMALDPLICSNFVNDQVSLCLQTVIASADDQVWEAIQSEIMSFCSSNVTNHYNQYYVVTLLASSYPRVLSLQYDLIRLFLIDRCCCKMDDDGSQDHLHDMALARDVIQYFSNEITVAFDELHSTMKMLAVLLKSSKMQWNTVQNFKKKDLISMLSKLSGGIKDNMPGVVHERGPVKDFIISLKLELQSSRCGEKVQKSMFDYAIEGDDSYTE